MRWRGSGNEFRQLPARRAELASTSPCSFRPRQDNRRYDQRKLIAMALEKETGECIGSTLIAPKTG